MQTRGSAKFMRAYTGVDKSCAGSSSLKHLPAIKPVQVAYLYITVSGLRNIPYFPFFVPPMSSHLHTENPPILTRPTYRVQVHPNRPAHPVHPTHSTHPTFSAINLLSPSVDIHGRRPFSNSCMTPIVGKREGLLIRHTITSLWETSAQPIRGDCRTSHSQFTVAGLCGACKRRSITIEMLSEDILLEIFDFYRLNAVKQSRGSPWKWHRLAHVCRKWRHVISMSPRRLDLQILCTSGASIERILDSWPTLPLIVRFKGHRESHSLPNNVAAALRHPDRLCELDLDVTGPIARLIVDESMQKPFQALKCIGITVNDASRPSLLVRGAFLGGSVQHLRELKLDGVAIPFPEIRQVLLSTNNLIDLHLSNIPNDIYFSPEDLVTALSTLVQLESLTIGFHSPASSPPSSTTPRPAQCITIPSLTFLDFHGTSEYLEEFVERTGLPSLCKITIKLFNQIFFELPRFCQFIPHLKMLGSPTEVYVTHAADLVSVSLFQGGKFWSEKCVLGTSCRRLDWQLSFVTQISTQLSSLLSSVRSISIKEDLALPSGEEDVDSTQWLELFRPFTHVTQVLIFGRQLIPGIVQALVMDTDTEVLPELTSLHLNGYRDSSSVAKAAKQFVATRSLSGRTVFLSD